MREIKFRGKRIDTGEWVYGWYYYCLYMNEHNILMNTHTKDKRQMAFEIDFKTLGGKTPFQDVEGNELFEGDICTDWLGRKLKVVFRKGKWQWEALGKTNFKYSDMFEWFEDKCKVEVIGNIHEEE